ncbi:Anoctamin-3 [Allomyces arbusculus]|nr:Anoctamin-3 [Allomyces arbusculus]
MVDSRRGSDTNAGTPRRPSDPSAGAPRRPSDPSAGAPRRGTAGSGAAAGPATARTTATTTTVAAPTGHEQHAHGHSHAHAHANARLHRANPEDKVVISVYPPDSPTPPPLQAMPQPVDPTRLQSPPGSPNATASPGPSRIAQARGRPGPMPLVSASSVQSRRSSGISSTASPARLSPIIAFPEPQPVSPLVMPSPQPPPSPGFYPPAASGSTFSVAPGIYPPPSPGIYPPPSPVYPPPASPAYPPVNFSPYPPAGSSTVPSSASAGAVMPMPTPTAPITPTAVPSSASIVMPMPTPTAPGAQPVTPGSASIVMPMPTPTTPASPTAPSVASQSTSGLALPTSTISLLPPSPGIAPVSPGSAQFPMPSPGFGPVSPGIPVIPTIPYPPATPPKSPATRPSAPLATPSSAGLSSSGPFAPSPASAQSPYGEYPLGRRPSSNGSHMGRRPSSTPSHGVVPPSPLGPNFPSPALAPAVPPKPMVVSLDTLPGSISTSAAGIEVDPTRLADQAANEHVRELVPLMVTEQELKERYGVGIQRYYKFIRFIVGANLFLALFGLVVWLPHVMASETLGAGITQCVLWFLLPGAYLLLFRADPDAERETEHYDTEENIIPQNRNVPFYQLVMRRTFTSTVFVLMVIGSYLLTETLQNISTRNREAEKNEPGGGSSSGTLRLMDWGISMALTMINFASAFVINQLTVFDRFKTRDHTWKAAIIKLFLFRVIGVIAFYQAIYQADPCSGGVKFFTLLISDLLLGNAFEIFAPQVITWVKFPWANVNTKSDEENKPEFDVAAEYVELLYRQYIIYLGSSQFPMVALLGAIVSGSEYVVDKYRMLRVCQEPKVVNRTLRVPLAVMLLVTAIFGLVGSEFAPAFVYSRTSMLPLMTKGGQQTCWQLYGEAAPL